MPPQQQLVSAAEILNRGKKVVMLVGAGALHARGEVLEAAEVLASPVVKTLPGKHAVPDGHPLTTGGIGLLGTKPVEALASCDTLLMVGTNFPYTKYLPEPGQARVVQIEIEAQRAGWRLATDVPLIGDSKETLKALMPHLERKTERGFLEEAQDGMGAWRDNMRALEDAEREPIQPQYLAALIDQLAADDAIMTCDSGTIATWAARHWHIRGQREFYISANLATMACGLPYAIGMQKAYPGRQVVAFVGDGGYAMLLMAETLTAIRYGLPVKIVINNNAEFGQILWEQMVLGYPEFGVRHKTLANFAPFAEANGAFAVHVENPRDLRQALERAFTHDGPALVDVVTKQDEPPMPPKVSYDEVKSLAEAFLKGQPRRAAIAKTIWRDQIDQLLT